MELIEPASLLSRLISGPARLPHELGEGRETVELGGTGDLLTDRHTQSHSTVFSARGYRCLRFRQDYLLPGTTALTLHTSVPPTGAGCRMGECSLRMRTSTISRLPFCTSFAIASVRTGGEHRNKRAILKTNVSFLIPLSALPSSLFFINMSQS